LHAAREPDDVPEDLTHRLRRQSSFTRRHDGAANDFRFALRSLTRVKGLAITVEKS